MLYQTSCLSLEKLILLAKTKLSYNKQNQDRSKQSCFSSNAVAFAVKVSSIPVKITCFPNYETLLQLNILNRY